MKKVAYRTRTGLTQFKPVMTVKAMWKAEEEYLGFCLACGSTRGSCEPDARRYPCEKCKAEKVYGIPELALMGLVVTR